MRINDIDKICMRDYIVGICWSIFSIAGMFISCYFDELPMSNIVSHSKTFGMGQFIMGVICAISFLFSLYYIFQTSEYQRYLGE